MTAPPGSRPDPADCREGRAGSAPVRAACRPRLQASPRARRAQRREHGRQRVADHRGRETGRARQQRIGAGEPRRFRRQPSSTTSASAARTSGAAARAARRCAWRSAAMRAAMIARIGLTARRHRCGGNRRHSPGPAAPPRIRAFHAASHCAAASEQPRVSAPGNVRRVESRHRREADILRRTAMALPALARSKWQSSPRSPVHRRERLGIEHQRARPVRSELAPRRCRPRTRSAMTLS